MIASEPRCPSDRPGPILAIVCTRCQQKHTKCSGPPACVKCARDNTPCMFKSGYRGRRRRLPLTADPVTVIVGPALSSTCLRCREQHLKCSGGPACHRCAKESLPCLFKQSRCGIRKPPLQQILTAARSAEAVPPSISLEALTNSKTSRSYKYFQEKTLPELSGNLDSEFWNALILRAAYSQPAVKHILTALGSLHESLELAYCTSGSANEDAQQSQVIAFQHHLQAIQLLKAGGNDATIETVLVSCILLVCFEALQRDLGSTIGLLRGGLNVLAQWRPSQQAHTSSMKDEVVPVITRVTDRLSQYVEAEAAISTPSSQVQILHQERTTLVPRTEIPSRFLDLRHARACLEDIFANLCSVVASEPHPPNYRPGESFTTTTQTLLDSWHTALNLDRHKHTSVQSQKETLSMETHYLMASIMNTAPYEQGEMRFDHHTEQFAAIVTLSESYLGLDNVGSEHSGHPSLQPFEVTGGIIPALSFCTLRCRCPKQRRKAMDLLNSRCWLEGFCHSLAAATMADCAIRIEEAGLEDPQASHDVPASNRIRFVRTSRLTGVFSPPEYHKRAPCVDENCTTPHARLELGFLLRPVRFLLRYVRAPWDSTCAVEEMLVDLPSCDQTNLDQRHQPDGMCLRSLVMNRRPAVPTDRVYTPMMFA